MKVALPLTFVSSRHGEGKQPNNTGLGQEYHRPEVRVRVRVRVRVSVSVRVGLGLGFCHF